jgi:hypothetical protein
MRKIFWVCSVITEDNKLLNNIINSNTQEEASSIFEQQNNGIKPKEILGPFYKKKTQILESTRSLKFTSQSKKMYYNDWLVNALFLEEPKDCAYLIFVKRVDDKKLPHPKGAIITPISELRNI